MRRFTIAAAFAVGLSGAASAATLDFISEANGNERGVVNGTSIMMDGVNVKFSSSHTAYFDSGNAGLGVCKIWTPTQTVNDNECNPSSDDNVTFGESVTIAFDFAMDLSNLLFSREGHTLFPNTNMQTLLFGINGDPLVQYTFSGLMAAQFNNVLSAKFAFDDSGTNSEQYYLASATAVTSINVVPLPAALPLLLAGVGGLGFMSRRRKRHV